MSMPRDVAPGDQRIISRADCDAIVERLHLEILVRGAFAIPAQYDVVSGDVFVCLPWLIGAAAEDVSMDTHGVALVRRPVACIGRAGHVLWCAGAVRPS